VEVLFGGYTPIGGERSKRRKKELGESQKKTEIDRSKTKQRRGKGGNRRRRGSYAWMRKKVSGAPEGGSHKRAGGKEEGSLQEKGEHTVKEGGRERYESQGYRRGVRGRSTEELMGLKTITELQRGGKKRERGERMQK